MRQVDGSEQLCLFEGMREEMDMSELRAQRAKMLEEGAYAFNTRRAAELDWAGFTAWCQSKRCEALPASAETLELYILAELNRGMKCSTVARRVCTVSMKHKRANLPSPVTPATWVLLTKTRIERQEHPNAKAPLSPDELRRISRALGNSARDSRDRAILAVGVASGMRRSELRALNVDDIEFERRGVTIQLRRSKRDQVGTGRRIDIFSANRGCCPVMALQKWLKVRGKWPGPLFTQLQPRNLTVLQKRLGAAMVNLITKRCVSLIGLDPKKFGAHSLRSGMVTAALDTGMDSLQIMERTGHKSLVTLKRYHHPKPFAFDVMAKAL